MLYLDRTDVLKELMLLKQVHKRVWYLSLLAFLSKGFMFQSYVCNRCHDLLSMNLEDIAILKINYINYGCIITGIS